MQDSLLVLHLSILSKRLTICDNSLANKRPCKLAVAGWTWCSGIWIGLYRATDTPISAFSQLWNSQINFSLCCLIDWVKLACQPHLVARPAVRHLTRTYWNPEPDILAACCYCLVSNHMLAVTHWYCCAHFSSLTFWSMTVRKIIVMGFESKHQKSTCFSLQETMKVFRTGDFQARILQIKFRLSCIIQQTSLHEPEPLFHDSCYHCGHWQGSAIWSECP